MEPPPIECFDTPEAPRLGCVSDAGLGPRAREADSHAWSSERLEGSGIENAGNTRASARPGVRSFLRVRPASRLDIATAERR